MRGQLSKQLIICREHDIQCGKYTIQPASGARITYVSVGNILVLCTYDICEVWNITHSLKPDLDPGQSVPLYMQDWYGSQPPRLIDRVRLAGNCKYATIGTISYPYYRTRTSDDYEYSVLYQTEDDTCYSVNINIPSVHKRYGPMKICAPLGVTYDEKTWFFDTVGAKFVSDSEAKQFVGQELAYSNLVYSSSGLSIHPLSRPMGTYRVPEGVDIIQAGETQTYLYAISQDQVLYVCKEGDPDLLLRDTGVVVVGHIKENVTTGDVGGNSSKWWFMPVTDEGYVLHDDRFLTAGREHWDRLYTRLDDPYQINFSAYSSLSGPVFNTRRIKSARS